MLPNKQIIRHAGLNYQLKVARFPHHRDLIHFNGEETPVSKAHIEQLTTALAVAAIHLGKRIRFYNTVDLVNQLEKEKQLSKAGNAKQLIQIDAVILDELGYLPFPESGRALLFHLVSHLYEKTSLIITTNLNVAESVQVFGDAS